MGTRVVEAGVSDIGQLHAEDAAGPGGRDSGSKILSPGDGSSVAGRTRGDPAVGSSRYCGLVVSHRGKGLTRSMSGRLRVAGDPRGVRMIPNMWNLRLRGLCGWR